MNTFNELLRMLYAPDDGAGAGAPPDNSAGDPPAAPPASTPPTPPVDPRPGALDGPYDEARGTKLIENLRAEKAALQEKARKFDELEQANMSDAEKLSNKTTAAEARADAAESKLLRMEIATAKGLTPEQAARLNGSTAEELNTDADSLLALFGQQPPAPPLPASATQVTPVLQPAGAGQELPDETDPAKLASRIPRR